MKEKAFLNIVLGGLCLIMFSGSQMADNPADQLLGVFWAPDKDGKIEMYKKNGKYFGRLIWGIDLELQDEKNPDPNLRTRRLQGIDIFMNFEFNEEDQVWEEGKIYNSRDGNYYSAELWYEDNNKKVLKVRGFMGLSIFGVTKDFLRVK